MWENLEIKDDKDWLVESIATGTCMAVTDGSYMEDIYPDICSAAFIYECQQGRGRIVGSFTERSSDAWAYRGELMGLMAIHLILRATNVAYPARRGVLQYTRIAMGHSTW